MHVSTNSSAVSSSPQDFDLSSNRSLCSLQILASYIGHTSSDGSLDAASNFLNHTLSTITSPEFSQIVVMYFWYDFIGAESWKHPDRPPVRKTSQAKRSEEVLRHRGLFEAFRRVHKVRDFRLQLCANVWAPAGEYSVGILKEVLAEETANGGFNCFPSKPFVSYFPCSTRL